MAAFEWDQAKNAANLAKHGISFEEAATIFEGTILSSEDCGSDDEVRERRAPNDSQNFRRRRLLLSQFAGESCDLCIFA